MKDFKPFLNIAAGLVCLALTLSAVVYVSRPAWYKNLKMEVTNQPYARTVSVTADGKVSAPPDIALINLSVVSQGATVKAVTADGNARMGRIIDAVKAQGVDPKDIQTASYYLNPDYTYDQKQAPRIVGFSLNQQVTVKVRRLDTVEDVLNAGIQAGANQVGQLSFDIDDPSKLKAEARQKAFDAARQQADDMAKSAGVSIGRVVTFSEGSQAQPPIYPMMMARSADMGGAPTPAPSIEPGSQEINVSVTVTYEIE